MSRLGVLCHRIWLPGHVFLVIPRPTSIEHYDDCSSKVALIAEIDEDWQAPLDSRMEALGVRIQKRIQDTKQKLQSKREQIKSRMESVKRERDAKSALMP
jgi:hypothetical protein